MPAERKISSESVTGLFTRVLMSPIPRMEEETNHSFQMELDSAQEAAVNILHFIKRELCVQNDLILYF